MTGLFCFSAFSQITVNPPQNVQFVFDCLDSEFCWLEPDSSIFVLIGYNVYNNGEFYGFYDDTTQCIEIAETDSLSYGVAALYSTIDTLQQESEIITVDTLFPYRPPQNVTEYNFYDLIWSPPWRMLEKNREQSNAKTNPQISYNVYRWCGWEWPQNFVLQNTSPIYDTVYSDENISDCVLQGDHLLALYYVTAVYQNGCESMISNIVVIEDIWGNITKNSPKSFKISPNPTKDRIQISSNYDISKLQIVDIAGNQVLKQNINHQNPTINISKLEQGVYLILLRLGNGEIAYSKLIKL